METLATPALIEIKVNSDTGFTFKEGFFGKCGHCMCVWICLEVEGDATFLI